MPAFPREITPMESTPFQMAGAMSNWGHSGKSQHRSFMQAGRVWTETYPPFKANGIEGRKFLALINDFWRTGTEFTISHYNYLTRNGTGGPGTPLVQGASQTGATLTTDGWGINQSNVLRAGDIVKIAGIKRVFDVTADASSNGVGTGVAIISINPPIFVGGSPADNAALTINGVALDAFIYSDPNLPSIGANQYIGGLTLTFRESV